MVRTRRQIIVGGAGAVAVALAGCSGFLQDENEFDETVPEEISDHLATANNIDGSITDRTGERELLVEVGPGGNFAYDPALVRIDTRTTVTWEWESSGHTVTGVSSNVETDTGRESSGYETSELFDEPGNYLYECKPHSSAGHRGAIVVE